MQRRALTEHLRHLPAYLIAATVGVTAAHLLSSLAHRAQAKEARPASTVHARLVPLIFEDLGPLPRPKNTEGTIPYATIRYVSPDGNTVAGAMQTNIGTPNHSHWLDHAFVWTSQDGLTDVGATALGADRLSQVHGVSDDGEWLVGQSSGPRDTSWFVWERSVGEIRDIAPPPGPFPIRSHINVGTVDSAGGYVVGIVNRTLYRWSRARGTELLAAPINEMSPAIKAVAPLCRAVVGVATCHAFLWTQENGLRDLGILPGMPGSVAYGVSDDGKIAVGASGHHLFRWQEGQTALEDLGPMPGKDLWPHPANPTGRAAVSERLGYQLSRDGSVILGRTGRTSFLWTRDSGIDALSDLLGDAGAPAEICRWSIEYAGLTPDGRNVTGVSSDPKGNLHRWRLHLPLLSAKP